MTTIDLTALFNALIKLLAALIMCFVIPYIRAHTNARQRETMRALIRSLVYAAEQIYGSGHGQEKLDWVSGQLMERGYEVDVAEIEAAVYDGLNSLKNAFAAIRDEEEPDEPEDDQE